MMESNENNVPEQATEIEKVHIIERFGTCAYCGQGKMIDAPEDKSQAEIDALVSDECKCIDATQIREKRERKEKIEEFVNAHFGENLRPFIHDSIDLIDRWDSQVNDITIKLIDDYSVKIWRDSDEKLHIRTKMIADDELKV